MYDDFLSKGEIQPTPLAAEIIGQLNTYANTQLGDGNTLNPKLDALLAKLELVKAVLPALLTTLKSKGYISIPLNKPNDLAASFPNEPLLNRLSSFENVVQGRSLSLKERLETFDNALGKLANWLSGKLHDEAPIEKRGGVLKQWGTLTAADELKAVLQVIFTPRRYDIIDAYYQGSEFHRSVFKPEIGAPEQTSFTSEQKRDLEVACGLLQNHLDKLERQVTDLTTAKNENTYIPTKLQQIESELTAVNEKISAIKANETIYDKKTNKIILPSEQSPTRDAYPKWIEKARALYSKKK